MKTTRQDKCPACNGEGFDRVIAETVTENDTNAVKNFAGKDLTEVIIDIAKTFSIEICESCNGTGRIEWECSCPNNGECDECAGNKIYGEKDGD